MRLITYSRNGNNAIGAWIDNDEWVVDLSKAVELADGAKSRAFTSMQSLIEAGEESWDKARLILENPSGESVFDAGDCTLLAPLPQPTQIRDCLCFDDHLANSLQFSGEQIIAQSDDPEAKRAELEAAGYFEVDESFYQYPVYYTCNRMSVVGPDVDVLWPAYSRYIDYELEWAAVIGKCGSQISKESARDFIFGYTIFNDWSARDEQMKAMGHALNIGPGQGKDFANGIGPCIVTADELADPYDQVMTARVNGEEVSRGNSSAMHYTYEDLIEFITRGFSVFPGELIGSGTVGTGCAFERGEMLAPGDVVELEVQDIGVLKNRVLAPHMG